MLEITPCLDRQVLAKYCKKCTRIASAAFYLYRAMDGDEVLAAGLFEVQSDFVQVVYYESADPDDHFLLDGILRAGFHYAEQQGIGKGCIPDAFREDHRNLFSRLNYPPNIMFDITNFFSKFKSCTLM